MPNKPNQKYISLKEAAKISGYSSDYIGYLIRTGKITGKQVYCHIAWMTTAEAVLAHKQREQSGGKEEVGFEDKVLDSFKETKHRIFWEIRTLKLFIKTFKYVLPIIIILILSFSALLFFIFSTKFQKSSPEAKQAIEEQKNKEPFLTY